MQENNRSISGKISMSTEANEQCEIMHCEAGTLRRHVKMMEDFIRRSEIQIYEESVEFQKYFIIRLEIQVYAKLVEFQDDMDFNEAIVSIFKKNPELIGCLEMMVIQAQHKKILDILNTMSMKNIFYTSLSCLLVVLAGVIIGIRVFYL